MYRKKNSLIFDHACKKCLYNTYAGNNLNDQFIRFRAWTIKQITQLSLTLLSLEMITIICPISVLYNSLKTKHYFCNYRKCNLENCENIKLHLFDKYSSRNKISYNISIYLISETNVDLTFPNHQLVITGYTFRSDKNLSGGCICV